MSAHLDALVRELADAVKGDPDDLPLRLRKAVIFAQSPLTAKIGGSTVAVPVQATGPIPPNGTICWVLESGPRRVLLDAHRTALGGTDHRSLSSARFSQAMTLGPGYSGPSSQTGWDWNGSTVRWGGRILTIAAGRGPLWASAGYFQFAVPADGTVINGTGGAADVTVSGGRIPISIHQALYAVPVIGGGPADYTYRLYGYTSGEFYIPDHAIFICANSENDGVLRTCDGQAIDYWRNVSYLNGWTTYDANHHPGQYRKHNGMVQLRGLIRSGTMGADAFVLPVGYRISDGPDATVNNVHFGVLSNALPGDVWVRGDGGVLIAKGDPAWVELAQITYPAFG